MHKHTAASMPNFNNIRLNVRLDSYLNLTLPSMHDHASNLAPSLEILPWTCLPRFMQMHATIHELQLFKKRIPALRIACHGQRMFWPANHCCLYLAICFGIIFRYFPGKNPWPAKWLRIILPFVSFSWSTERTRGHEEKRNVSCLLWKDKTNEMAGLGTSPEGHLEIEGSARTSTTCFKGVEQPLQSHRYLLSALPC